MSWQHLLAIALIAGTLVWLTWVSKSARTIQVLSGLGVVLGAMLVGEWFDVFPNHWELTRFWPEVVLGFVILFQPELRRMLAQLGRNPFRRGNDSEGAREVEEIVKAAVSLANRRIGGILVVEREHELLDVVEVGTLIEARISKELLISLFLPYSPLHDGAVIVRGKRILAAGCFLPLTARTDGIETYGTRHRAALGITEETDAVAIAISEETGTISLVVGGDMYRDLDGSSLRQHLLAALRPPDLGTARQSRLDRVRP
ncbi:MAG: TIGR00159 family protein [Nitrospirae bacterium]|nr:TIGR00159 family protein [Nitrospirota bacterium]